MTKRALLPDELVFKGRALPGMAVVAPLAFCVFLPWPDLLHRLAFPIIFWGGGALVIAALTRPAGLRAEERLRSRWGGLPAQRSLWATDADNVPRTERRRRAIEQLTGERLPTRRLERSNPEEAKRLYDIAVRAGISKVRSNELLQTANVEYSFYRNAYGVRRWGVAVAAGTALGSGASALLGDGGAAAIAVAVAAVICLGIWITVVNEPWVRTAADAWSDRFFEAVSEENDRRGECVHAADTARTARA